MSLDGFQGNKMETICFILNACFITAMTQTYMLTGKHLVFFFSFYKLLCMLNKDLLINLLFLGDHFKIYTRFSKPLSAILWI